MVKPFTIEIYQQLGDKPLTREDCIKHKIHYRNGEVPDFVWDSPSATWRLRSVAPDGFVINNCLPYDFKYDLLIDVEDEIVDTELYIYQDDQGHVRCTSWSYLRFEPKFKTKLTINLTTKEVKAEVI